LPQLKPGQNSGEIAVTYPGGAAVLNFWRAPDRPAVLLNFKGDFKSWFENALEAGDEFFVDVEEGESATGDVLKFLLPELEPVQETVDNLAVVAVRPDWTDSRGLLGYFNPLTDQYVVTPFLKLLLRADEEYGRARAVGRAPSPFFAILDEMNLARVEHYFSDLLSCLESGESLELHSMQGIDSPDSANGLPVPERLQVPPNVFFVGTVNVDETTYMFSPKVLDRAFTIELDDVVLGGHISDAPEPSPLHLGKFTGLAGEWCRPTSDDWEKFGRSYPELEDALLQLHETLRQWHRHFGYRVANEIARFVALAASEAEDAAAPDLAFDLAVLEKVLPKFHGTQQELDEPLRELFRFAIGDALAQDAGLLEEKSWRLTDRGLIPAGTVDGPLPSLPRTAAKVWRMRQRLREQGFTSFLE